MGISTAEARRLLVALVWWAPPGVRQVLGGILWKLHTGRPWRDVPGRFGPWQSCYGRLRRWQGDGTWPRIWAVLADGDDSSGHHRRGQASQALLAAAPVATTSTGLVTPPPA